MKENTKEKTNKKKKRLSQPTIVMFIFYLIMGIGCGHVISSYMLETGMFDLPLGQYTLRLLLFIVAVYAVIFLQIVIHEGGHLIFGLMSGYKFTSFRVANLMLIKEKGKLKFKRYSLAGTGGQCLMEPPDMVDGNVPYKLYNLGGVLLNFITAVLLLTAAFFIEVPLLDLFMKITAFAGITFAFTNGIPLKGEVANDGSNLLTLKNNPEGLRAFWIQMKSNSLVATGLQLSDMPAEWFREVPPEEMNDQLKAYIGISACNRYMELGEFDKAHRLISSYLAPDANLIGIYRYMLVCEQIFCQLIIPGSVGENGRIKPEISTSIEALLDKSQRKFMKSMKNFPSIIRTEYAMALLLNGDETQATSLKKQFEKVGRTYPYSSDYEAERSLIELVESIYQKRKV